MATIKFTIDGREIECEEGTSVLQAALDNGIFIPHYCYHPALSVAGNCRMCLVEIVPKLKPGQKPPPKKPAIACATTAAPGMEILTDSEMVVEARRGVLESLLVNHPLDCPICDQAGECDLQDFSFGFGEGHSRFREDKEVKHTKDFGPEVRLYGNRCINCTRCVRFTQEIAGTADIAQVNRGGRAVVDIFPGSELTSPLSGNVVDLCPVGALVSRDFLHKARVWQLDATPSVCPHCSTGCSIEVHTHDELIARLKPMVNPEVNGYWMCDYGRRGYNHIHDGRRLGHFELGKGEERRRVSFQAAIAALAERWKAAGEGAWALASAWMTNEELWLLKQIVPAERIALLAREPWEELRFFPKWGDSERNPSLPGQHERGKLYADGATFVMEADRNPNRSGARAILGEEALGEERFEALIGAANKGKVAALLAFSCIPDLEVPAPLVEAMEKVEFVATVDLLQGPLSDGADLVLPACGFAEQEGTYTNGRGTTQRLSVARPAAGHARPALESLYALGRKLDVEMAGFTAKRVFAALTESVELFEGLSWEGLRRSLRRRWSPHHAAEGKRPVKHPVLPETGGDKATGEAC